MDAKNYKELKKQYPELYSDLHPGIKGPKYYMVLSGFETPKGWFNLLKSMSEEVSKIVKEKSLINFRFDQIKSKFGFLCLYTNNEYKQNELKEIHAVMDKYEEEASITCEFCGSKNNVKRINTGWIYTLCESCVKEKKK